MMGMDVPSDGSQPPTADLLPAQEQMRPLEDIDTNDVPVPDSTQPPPIDEENAEEKANQQRQQERIVPIDEEPTHVVTAPQPVGETPVETIDDLPAWMQNRLGGGRERTQTQPLNIQSTTKKTYSSIKGLYQERLPRPEIPPDEHV
jgi:hypothetical protein